jgi:hypothetical protein
MLLAAAGARLPPPVIGGGPPGGPRHEGGLQGIFNSTPNAGPDQGVTGWKDTTRSVFDPVTSQQVDAMIRAQRPPAEINAFLQGQKSDPIPAAALLAAERYHQAHPEYKNSFAQATKGVPTTLWQNISGSGPAAASVGFTNGLTAGGMDEAAGGISALLGGDYTQTRDLVNSRKHALADTHPSWDVAGNLAGGLAGTLGGEALLTRGAPGALALGGRVFGRAAPAAGDVAYGATYGGLENNEDRTGGALGGGALALGAGMGTRATMRGLSSVIAPQGGGASSLYEAGVFPTIGQRLMASDNGAVRNLVGRPYNALEQASQSLPFVGAAPQTARQAARDQWQIGGFNHALSDIGHRLPDGMAPGTEPHAYAKQVFDQAYDAARSGMTFVPDATYKQDIGALVQRLNSGEFTKEQAQQVRSVAESAVGTRLAASPGGLSGNDYKAAASELGRIQANWAGSEAHQLQASALGDYINVLDNAARRNSAPEAVAAMDNADRGYAKYVRIQRASELGGAAKDPGTYTPTTLLQASKSMSGSPRSAEFLRGDALMQDYGMAGRPLVDTLANSGTADRIHATSVGQAGTAAGLGALGFVSPTAAGAASIPLALTMPGVNTAATRAIAPRAVTLPPDWADAANFLGAQINNRAPIAGRLAVPFALGLGADQ